MLGRALEHVFAPIGFNWQISIALVPGLAAREVAVGALGTVYALSAAGDDVAGALAPLIASGWSLATALSLLAWYVFAPQCLSTLAVVKRETNSWRYPLIMAGLPVRAGVRGVVRHLPRRRSGSEADMLDMPDRSSSPLLVARLRRLRGLDADAGRRAPRRRACAAAGCRCRRRWRAPAKAPRPRRRTAAAATAATGGAAAEAPVAAQPIRVPPRAPARRRAHDYAPSARESHRLVAQAHRQREVHRLGDARQAAHRDRAERAQALDRPAAPGCRAPTRRRSAPTRRLPSNHSGFRSSGASTM